jgi:Ubiquitin-conjugating enzyme
MLTMRTRRIENEWLLLEALQRLNPGRIRPTRAGELVSLEVDGFSALRYAPVTDESMGEAVTSHHCLRIAFPRYYPTMPVEVYLDAPVFHPNVNPDNGFVCLWTRHRVQTTLEQTIAQLQRVLAWAMLNPDASHVVQPDALHWYARPGMRDRLPLHFTPMAPVQSQAWDFDRAPARRRLS